ILYTVKSSAARSKDWNKNLNAEDKKQKATREKKTKKLGRQNKIEAGSDIQHPFPPSKPSAELKENIVSNWCKDTSPDSFMESGCAVCGQLTLVVVGHCFAWQVTHPICKFLFIV